MLARATHAQHGKTRTTLYLPAQNMHPHTPLTPAPAWVRLGLLVVICHGGVGAAEVAMRVRGVCMCRGVAAMHV